LRTRLIECLHQLANSALNVARPANEQLIALRIDDDLSLFSSQSEGPLDQRGNFARPHLGQLDGHERASRAIVGR
jgi:hypothetical protein